MSSLPVPLSEATPDPRGVGWAWPTRIDHEGIAVARNDDAIDRAIYLILATTPGERPMRPEFGCGIHGLVFEPIDATTEGKIKLAVQDSLARWEPRIDDVSVSVLIDKDALYRDSGGMLLYIDVSYRVRATNSPRNFVFPFYTIPPEH